MGVAADFFSLLSYCFIYHKYCNLLQKKSIILTTCENIPINKYLGTYIGILSLFFQQSFFETNLIFSQSYKLELCYRRQHIRKISC